MSRLVQSPSYEALAAAATGYLKSIQGAPEILVLAHSRGAADDLVRNACTGGFLGVHRMTFTALAVDLAEAALARDGLSPLGGLSAEAMVARIIHQLKSDGIPYFQPVAGTPGLARAVAATVAELRLEKVPPDAVAATGAPGRDLARMAERFDAELAAARLADFALLLRYAVRTARHGRHRLLGLPVVLLDVDLKSALHRELAEAVLAHAPDYFDGRLAQAPAPAATTLDRVRHSLFNSAAGGSTEPDGTLEYFSAAGESLECVEIARRMARSAAAGMAFDRMAILLRSPERYQPLVEEALRRAAIPAYFSRGVQRPDPAGRAFLALLACAAEGCSATRFAEYLSLGQAPPLERQPPANVPQAPDDELLARVYEGAGPAAPPAPEPDPPENEDAPVIGGTLQTPRDWERLLVDAAVIGGRDRWQRRLRGLEAEFRLRLADLDPKDESRRPQLRREIERLRNLTRFALPLIDLLAALPVQAAWGDWIERLTALAAASLRRPESVQSVLAELQVMAEVGPVSLEEVTGVLSERLRSLRREPEARRYGGVFVSGIDEARGRVFDMVFLPGLCEGLFPSRSREDPILLDVYRKALNERQDSTAVLRVQDDRVADERRRLHIACGVARGKLVFSYPRVDAVESRPRVPSFYALEIVRAANGRLPELRKFEEDARRGAPSRLDWPAPDDPVEAIDDAEFDLAAMGRTFALSVEDARATGRYLMSANAHLVRSLYSYARRARSAWTYADGIVNPDEATRAVLAHHRLAARSYSPSALQHFSACPYRFLLHAIHRFHPREEKAALEQMDPLTRGALFHETQWRLFGAWKEARLLPLRPQNAAQALALADRVLAEVAAKHEEDLAPAIPRVWRSEIEDLRTDLRGWIEQVAADTGGWVPAHFEYSFGMAADASRDAASTPLEAVLEGGTRLRGAIDLIERHAERTVLRITDHKTGRPPQDLPKYVAGGAMLQPLAYAMAAEALLGVPCEVSRLSYCTQRGGYEEIPFDIQPGHRRFFLHVMKLIDAEIDRGFLPAAPQKEACVFCDFRPVCGPNEERRTSKKRTDDLENLQQLRNIP